MNGPAPTAPLVAEVSRVSKEFVLRHGGGIQHRFVGLVHRRWRPRKEQFSALTDVSFELRRGEALALLGHNGSGKSTLLQLVAGILTPTSGAVRTHGRVAPLIELGVGFHPDLTGEENIFLNGSLFGISNRQMRARYDAIVDFSGLGDFIDTPVKHYSSGMTMRLGFSVAVHTEPDLLLADEVLAVGDAEFREKCQQRIREMQAGGMALILVTHAIDQARAFCHRYMRLDHGIVVEQGVFD